MSAWIVSVGTAVPDYHLSQDEIKAAVRRMFGSQVPNLDRLLTIFDHSGIERRHFCMPLEWFSDSHTIEEKHRLYVEHAAELSEKAVLSCIDKAGVRPEEIGHMILVTTTGTSTPSIDAYLCNRLKLSPHIKRTPIWGLGCAGGAAGLARAAEYVRAFPDELCLLVAVELCTLTFLREDTSKSSIVATSLFADGAAAALIAGAFHRTRKSGAQGKLPQIVSSQSTIWPDTLDVMGWEVTNAGLKVVFSKDIPSIVNKHMKENVKSLLRPRGLGLTDVKTYVLHPGGMKVLEAYQSSLDLPDGALESAERVLRSHGNMSSCTVLFVLEDMLRRASGFSGYGLAGALGPGFSSELLLMQW